MFRPLTTLRRWLRSHSQKDTPPVVSALPKFRPALTALEDHIAPGDILSGVLAAAIGGALLNPMDQLTAWVGTPSAGTPSLPTARPTTISVGAGVRPSADDVQFPRYELARPERDAITLVQADAGTVAVRTDPDDQFLFAPAAQPATLPHLDAQTTANAAPAGDSGAGGVQVGSATPSAGSGGVVNVAGPNDGGILILRPQATSERVSDVPNAIVPPSAGGIQVSAATTLDPSQIVNAVPTVGADSGKWLETSEDTPLTIAISGLMANDSDPDGDTLFLSNWDMSLPNGILEQISDTEMKFTPSEDFNGTQTFGYSVSDGIATASGTATITVLSVNDAPSAFNDAYRFYHGKTPYPYYPVPIPYTALDQGSVILNDTDVESLPAPNVQVDTAGLIGTINMNSTGNFSWSGLDTFYGETSFKYRTTDYSGAWTNWATVKLFALSSDPGEGGVSTYPDEFPVGIEGQTLNVRYNDGAGDGYAVLTSRPPAQHVKSFDFSGEFKYTPTTPTGFSFTYRVFGSGGAVSFNTNVQMTRVQLDIFHGGVPATADAKDIEKSRVREDAKVKVGAFTVVNQNDTDGDCIRDHQDEWVNTMSDPEPAWGKAVGVNEVDLMRLRVYRPAPAFPGNLVLSVESGTAKIYNHPDKGEAPIAKLGTPKTIFATAFAASGQTEPVYRDYWVEVFEPSNNMQDVTIRLAYDKASVDVKATGVWSTMTGFRTEGTLSILNDQPALRANYAYHGGKLGLLTMHTPDEDVVNAAVLDAGDKAKALDGCNTSNAVEMEFTVTPVDIYRARPVVTFDVTRTADGLRKIAPSAQPDRSPFLPALPSNLDQPNDDPGWGEDNDNDLFSAPFLVLTGNGYHNRLYSFDGPGRNYETRVFTRSARFQYWLNAWEFVRVKIGPNASFAIPTVLEGSRASEYGNWHSWMDITPVPDQPQFPGNNIWFRPAVENARNQIKRDLGAHPVFEFQND